MNKHTEFEARIVAPAESLRSDSVVFQEIPGMEVVE